MTTQQILKGKRTLAQRWFSGILVDDDDMVCWRLKTEYGISKADALLTAEQLNSKYPNGIRMVKSGILEGGRYDYAFYVEMGKNGRVELVNGSTNPTFRNEFPDNGCTVITIK